MFGLSAMKNKLAMVVMLISGIALLGWLTDHNTLVSWLPSIADMTFNTALLMLLVALASLRSGGCRWVGIGVGLFAALSLSQDFFGLNLGIDNFLFNSHGYGLSSPYPGRMSPITATGFLFSGIILIALDYQQRMDRFALLTHGMILLLLLLSILGISLNFFIGETPVKFAHFASMSLATSVSLLLLTANFFNIYKQKHQQAGLLGNILHSGIHLMYNLKYPKKFLLISAVMFIPLAFLMWTKLNGLSQNVATDEGRIYNIHYILQMNKLLKALPEHRGMVNANLASQANVFDEKIQQKRHDIDRLFGQNGPTIENKSRIIDITDEWNVAVELWKNITSNQRRPPMVLWNLHTQIIALLNKHLRDISKSSLLSFDSEPLVHNLVAIQLEVLPHLFEKTGHLRGLGAGYLVDGTVSLENKLALSATISQVLLLLREFKQLMLVALKKEKQVELAALQSSYVALTEQFLNTIDSYLIKDNKRSLATEAYFSQASKALNVGYELRDYTLLQVEGILKKRIIKNTSYQYTINLSAVLIILIIVYLFSAFYHSLMHTIRALDHSAQRMISGQSDELTSLPVQDEMGEVINSFNSISKELLQVSSQMSAVIDHTAEGIITIDEHSLIKSFNPAAETIFDYKADEVIGKKVTMLMPEEHQHHHQQRMLKFHQNNNQFIDETNKPISAQGLKKDGSKFSMELSVSFMALDGQPIFIGMVRDVTRQKEMEVELLHAQKMEAVGALVGGVAHNFNNLLAGIVGKAYLAKRKISNKPQEAIDHITSIELIALRAGEMVGQLLTFAHKDIVIKKDNASLAKIVKEGFKTAELGIEENIDLALNVDVSAEQLIYCDVNQIQQVLMNMMNNARDAVANRSKKTIAVNLNIYTPDKDFLNRYPQLNKRQYACLSIVDSGHGMDEQTKSKIFDPFYTTKEVGKGTGLGLSSAFGSIVAHKGIITVESEINIGSTFRVYLPLVEPKESSAEADKKQSIVSSSKHELVLLVDDEQLVIESMQEVLEDLGYKTITALNGQEGLQCFVQNQQAISLIITDVVMPKKGGVEMLEEIRKIDQSVPVIFITGYADGNKIIADSGTVNTVVLPKPVQVQELSITIQEMLTTAKSSV